MSETVTTPPLTHLFTVLYTDGSTFAQGPDDRPAVPRPDGTGSAFSDVRVDDVMVFFLESGSSPTDPNKHLYMVDLRDGHFEIDGVPFFVNDPGDGRRHLVYFRRVLHQKNTSLKTGETKHYTRRSYHLGYQVHGRTVTIDVGHEIFDM